MTDTKRPIWQPISMLPTISGIIDGELADAEEHYATLLQVREKPYVLDDATVDRSIKLHTEQLDFTWVLAIIKMPPFWITWRRLILDFRRTCASSTLPEAAATH